MTPCKMVTPENFILKLCTRDDIEEVTYYTFFDADRLRGGALPVQSNGQTTWAPCAVERDVRSGRGSIRASARARPPTKKELFQIIPMHMMTREMIPGRKTEDSTVSSINCYRSSLI